MNEGGSGDRFRHASARECDLNARQREVLALVARGLTNAEIGEALGVTLDGAKWNVSEILSKLGLASREEAAAYWRWRQRPAARLSRLARAAVPAFGWKWIAGGSVAVVAACGIAAGVLLPRGGDEPKGPGGPFELEARIVVTSDAAGSGLGPNGAPVGTETTTSLLTWQWADHRHYRWTIEQDSSADMVVTTTEVVADGSYQWSVSSVEPTYRRDEILDLPADAPAWLPFSLMIGPAPAGSVRELVAYLEAMMEGPGDFVRVAEMDRLLGRDVEIVEFGPAWRSGSSENGGPVVESGSGLARLWVDPDSMFILRYETMRAPGDDRDPTEEVVAEVLSVEETPDFDAATFEFTPPADKILDARTKEDQARGVAVLETDVTGNEVWPGYYAITALPPGYGFADWTRDGTPPMFTVGIRGPGTHSKVLENNDYVRVRQSPSTGSVSIDADDTVPLGNGRMASMSVADGLIRIWWDDGEVRVEIEANALSPADVIEFASGLQKR